MPIGANISDVGAGSLRELFAFDKRATIDDGAGNTEGAFEQVFLADAAKIALKGGEAVMAARLEGRQPFIVTVRCHPDTLAVNTDWRCRDVNTGATYAITTHVVRQRRDFIDMICVEGVADAQRSNGQ